MWKELVEAQSPLLAEIVCSDRRCDEFLKQLGTSVRNGVLSTSPPSLRAQVLQLFERNCVELCRGADINRLRMVYETLRDHLGNPSRDGPKIAAQLRDSAIKSLTTVIIALDCPSRDPRLTKFHIELLYRLLDGQSGTAPVAGTAVQDALQDRRLLAAECLQSLEAAFPTLLAADASSFVALAAKEANRPTPGFVHTQLAATIVSNLTSAYLHQQEQYYYNLSYGEEANSLTDGDDGDALSSLEDGGDTNNTEEVLAAAAEMLCMPGGSKPMYDDEDELEVEYSMSENNTVDSSTNHGPEMSATAESASVPVGETPAPATPLRTGPKAAVVPSLSGSSKSSSGLRRTASMEEASGSSSPRGILLSTTGTATSVPSKQSSRKSMLASVAEADELTSSEGSESNAQQAQHDGMRDGASSALTVALRRSMSLGERSTSDAIAWTAASTPRSIAAEMIILQRSNSAGNLLAANQPLKRFTVPVHIVCSDPDAAPRLVMTSDAQAALQDAAQIFLGAMRRLDPAAVVRMSKALPPVLQAARPSPTSLWPTFERQLSTGSTPLLRAVLDLHDALPEIFEGRGPSLVEKVLSQVNDPTQSPDHRVVGASWVLRQHAQQRHSGGALLLADSWQQLLPLPREPPQLAAIKIKALGACLAAGVGDEEVVCRGVCTWEGFGGVQPTEQQLRAFTYALRILHGSAPEDGPAAHRTHACLVASALETIVSRPQLVPAVDAFLETCPDPFAGTFLRAVNALFSGVDGQFEVLRERPEDAPFQGTTADLADRVKAAVISRSSSLSGLMRGLSFRLSFTKRTHSLMPMSSRGQFSAQQQASSFSPRATSVYGGGGSAAATPRGAVDVRALRSSVTAAFQNEGGGSSMRRHPAAAVPVAAVVATPRSSTGTNTINANNLKSMNPFLPPMSARGSSIGESILSSEGWGEDDIVMPSTLTVPLDLPTHEAAEAWLSSPATWESLACGLLRHDLMAYRLLLKRVLRNLEVHPRGTLRTLSNYTWQYKEYHPTHSLPSKEAGGAILALCLAAALVHLPCREADGWTLRQSELAEGVQNVLDALEEGYPVAGVQHRCQVLAKTLAEESAWTDAAWGDTLEVLLTSCVDAAVQG